MPDEYVAKKVNVDAYYDGSNWIVDYQPAFDEADIIVATHIKADAVTTAKILNANVTLAKIEALTAGQIIVGNASNRPTAVTMSGVATISNAGVVAYVAGSITNTEIHSAAAVALTKLAAMTASKVVVSDAGGFMVPASTTTTEVNYLNTSVPGTAVASKVAVLGANKNLDQFATAALYLGAGAGTLVTSTAAELNKLTGVTATTAELNKLAGLTSSTAELNKLTGVTTTAAQLNYLATATSDIQTQINSVATLNGLGLVTADTVLVVETLQGSYMIDSTAGVITVTLPQASTLVDGTKLQLTHYKAANNVTVSGHALDPGVGKTGTTAATASFAINSAGDTTTIILKSGTWYQLN
jgi:hypothetical protein